MNIRIGEISQFIFGNYSFCSCCNTTWNLVPQVAVEYDENGKGCFTLCVKCWNELNTQQRIEYYQKRFNSNLTEDQVITMTKNIMNDKVRIW